MTTGFVQRFKGKVKLARFFIDHGSSALAIVDSPSGTNCRLLWTNAGAPTNGAGGTLAGFAQPGDIVIDTTDKSLYQNTNTLASPTWTIFESSGGAGSFTTLVASGLAQLNGGFLSPPAAGGATKTLTSANAGSVIRLDTAAGSVITLPAATGSGAMFQFAVTQTTTSGAHKILAASSSDNLIGNVAGQTGNAVKQFSAAHASGFHSLQMPFAGSQPSGGFEGDWFDVQDILTNTWMVSGMYQAGTTPTTPFSTATS